MVNDIVLIVLPPDFSKEYRKRNWRYESGIISKDSYSGPRRFSFGTAFISKALLMAGFTPVVFDAFANMWIEKKQLSDALANYPSKIFGISAISTNYGLVKWLVSEIKKLYPDSKVIVGGVLATHSYHIVLKNTKVDICVLGEGEETIVELIDNLINNNSINDIAGIAYRKDGEIVKTADREYLKDIDQFLPLPYELFDMEFYTHDVLIAEPDTEEEQFYERGVTKTFSMITGRGCPKNCAFCSKNFKGVRFHSIDKIISEIEKIKNEYNVRVFHFVDDLLIVNKKRTIEICEKVKPLNILWDGQSRIDTVDREILQMLKDAGCAAIGYGVESGNDMILKKMKKGITREQIKKSLRETIEIGIPIKIQLMAGYPGESKETIKDTVSLFKEIGHPGRRFAIVTPLPGSELFTYAIETGLIKNEEEYLYRIQDGYGSEVDRITCNCTDMPDDELLKIIRHAERKMLRNYLFHHRIKKYKFWRYHIANALSNPKGYIKREAKLFGIEKQLLWLSRFVR